MPRPKITVTAAGELAYLRRLAKRALKAKP